MVCVYDWNCIPWIIFFLLMVSLNSVAVVHLCYACLLVDSIFRESVICLCICFLLFFFLIETHYPVLYFVFEPCIFSHFSRFSLWNSNWLIGLLCATCLNPVLSLWDKNWFWYWNYWLILFFFFLLSFPCQFGTSYRFRLLMIKRKEKKKKSIL